MSFSSSRQLHVSANRRDLIKASLAFQKYADGAGKTALANDLIDGFARNVRDGLPNASFIGFTGTPIDEKDRSTPEIFGEYIDVYDMTQAIEDGVTVKVFYEPRLAKVELPEQAPPATDE